MTTAFNQPSGDLLPRDYSWRSFLELGMIPSAAQVTLRLQDCIIEREQLALREGLELADVLSIDHADIRERAAHLAQLVGDARFGCELASEQLESRAALFERIGFPASSVAKPRRWFYKALLRDERRLTDYWQHICQRIGRNGAQIVSNRVLASRRVQCAQQQKFIDGAEVSTVASDGQLLRIPFSQVCNTARKRFGKTYVRLKGLEAFCLSRGLLGYFVTLTLPARFHPNPKFGNGAWDGASPMEGHADLQMRWRSFQRRFGKVWGVRVQEHHRDGCVHWHLLMWVAPERDAEFRDKLNRYFGPYPATKVELIDTTRASGASYLAKYLQKTCVVPELAGADASTAERSDAHRATWGGRSAQFFDVPSSGTVWDEVRRIRDTSPQLAQLGAEGQELRNAAMSNDYATFLERLAMLRAADRIGIWYGSNESGTRVVRGLLLDQEHIDTHVSKWTLAQRSPPGG